MRIISLIKITYLTFGILLLNKDYILYYSIRQDLELMFSIKSNEDHFDLVFFLDIDASIVLIKAMLL